MKLELRTETRDDVILLRLSGVLDEAGLPELKSAIDEALASVPRGILVDFREVNGLDPDVLGSLLSAYGRCKEAGVPLKFASLHPRIARHFFVARLNRVFELFDNAETALLSYRRISKPI